MWNSNGILVQGLKEKTNYIKNFKYQGINAFFQFPLAGMSDKECRMLTERQQSKAISENYYMSLEFISDKVLYDKYIKKCREMNIEIRTLFIESSYADEIWRDEVPQKRFIGYEYCPIPIDEQIITDMDWYKPFSKYWSKLNEYGLFDSLSDVKNFEREYNQAFEAGYIGDGCLEPYICRVSLVCNEPL